MTISYTPINTTPENLGENNLLYFDACDIPEIGSLVRTRVEKLFSISVPRATNPVTFDFKYVSPIISERAITLPYVSVSDLSALVTGGHVPWTTVLVETFPMSQRKVTRSVTIPGKGSLVHVYTETEYKENGRQSFSLSLEELYWVDGALVSGTDLVAGDSAAAPHHGEVWVNGNSAPTTITSLGTWEKFIGFDQNGHAGGAIPDHTSDHVTAARDGTYMASASASFYGVPGDSYEVGIQKNNGDTVFNNIVSRKKIDVSGDTTISISGLVSLEASDTVELWARQYSGTPADITIVHATLSIVETGR